MNVVIETDRIRKQFSGGRWALEDVSLRVQHNSVFGFIGPNGAGKTTTIRILLGLLRPSGGSARLLGRPCTDLDCSTKARVACVLENRGLLEDLSVDDNLAIWARIFRIDGVTARHRADHLLDALGLKSRISERVCGFSSGMKAKVMLARALLSDPELLILDEPTAGLDPLVQREVLDLIKLLQGRGKTIFMSSHNLAEVEGVCTSLAVIDGGRIVASDNTSAMLRRFKGLKKHIVIADAPGRERLLRVLAGAGGVIRSEVNHQAVRVLFGEEKAAAEISECLALATVPEARVEEIEMSLEDVFQVLVHRKGTGGMNKWSGVFKTF